MNFEIISAITDIEPIAVGNSIRDIRRLRRTHGERPLAKAERYGADSLEEVVGFGLPSFIGTRRTALAERKSSANAICIESDETEKEARSQIRRLR